MLVGLADANATHLTLSVERRTEHEVEPERMAQHLHPRTDRRLVECPLDLGTRPIAAGVHDAVVAVAALTGERDVGAALFRIECGTETHEIADRLGCLGDELAHDRLVAQTRAGLQRVAHVVLDRVGRVQHPGEPALGPLRRTRRQDVLRDHQDAADRPHGQRRRQACGTRAEHDDVDVAFPGGRRGGEPPRKVHVVTRRWPTACRWRSSAPPTTGHDQRSHGRRTPRRCRRAAIAAVWPG